MKTISAIGILLTVAAVAGCRQPTSVGNNQSADTAVTSLGTMAVGDVRVITFKQAENGLDVPSSPASAQYALVVANAARDTGSVPQYTVVGNHVGPAASVPGVRMVRQVLRTAFTGGGGERGRRFEAGLRTYERRHLRLPAPHRARMTRTILADRVPVGTVPAIGSVYQFNVPTGSTDPCTQYTTVTARVETVSSTAIIMADTTSPTDGFTTADYDSIGSELDNYIYPTEVGYYGNPTDIDQNGHVYVLYTPAVNKLTPPGTIETQGYVAGFTFAGDFFPAIPEAQGGCPESNEGEIFYLMTPDPTGQFGNVFSTAMVRQGTRSTIAHELQHAINAGNRVVNNAPAFETAWLDEALSSLAEDDVGRAELGYGDLQTLSLNDMASMDTTMFGTFFGENFARAQRYVTRPDTIGPVVSDARVEQDLAAFGAGWAFLRYIVDRYSNGAPRTLTRQLVAGPDTGVTNLTTATGAPLDSLLAHWLVTLYTDGVSISGLSPQYTYKTYDFRDIVTSLCPNASCSGPTYLPETVLNDGTQSISVGIPSTSADYFVIEGGPRTIKIQDSTGAAATDPYGRLYVVRTQ